MFALRREKMEVFKIKKKEQVTDFRIKKLNVAAYVRVSTEKENQLHKDRPTKPCLRRRNAKIRSRPALTKAE